MSVGRLTVCRLESPVGLLSLAVDEDGAVRALSFGEGAARTAARFYPKAAIDTGEAPDATDRLQAYFGGDHGAVGGIAWAVQGDGFAQRVWRALAEIPAGTTISYGEMARRAGEPGGAQAAGAALNANPIAVVLPCHRVVGADGSMTGFGGGLERKTWLLRHEGALLL